MLYPFEAHPELNDRQTFADGIPYVVRDLTFIKAAFDILHPDLTAMLRISGAHIEELLFGCMSSLFSGSLPSQSLFRLWDMLLCSSSIEAAAAAPRGARCGDPPAPIVDTDATEGHALFGTAPHGRRILIAFAYSVLTSAFRQLPPEALPGEIRAALKAHLLALRDPSRIVETVDRGYYILFTSKGHLRSITALTKYYIAVRTVPASDH